MPRTRRPTSRVELEQLAPSDSKRLSRSSLPRPSTPSFAVPEESLPILQERTRLQELRRASEETKPRPVSSRAVPVVQVIQDTRLTQNAPGCCLLLRACGATFSWACLALHGHNQ